MIADLLLALHLLGAIFWVGGMGFALLVLRPSLSVLQPADRLALHRQVFRRFFLIVWHAMPIVLITGYAMLFGVFGGFAHVGWNVHVMHLIGLIMAAAFLVIFFGPWATLRRPGSDAAAPAALNRIRQLVVLNLLLGVIVVVIAAMV